MILKRAEEKEGKELYKSFMARNTLLDYKPEDSDFEEASSRFKESLLFVDGEEEFAFVGYDVNEPEELSVFHNQNITVEQAEGLLEELKRAFRSESFLPNLDENGFVLRISSDAKSVFEEAAKNYYHYEFVDMDQSVEELDCERLQVVIDKPIGLEFRADTYRLSNLEQLENDIKDELSELFDADVEVTFMSGSQTLIVNLPYRERFDVNYFTSSDAVYTADDFRGGGKRAEVVSRVMNILDAYGISSKRAEFGQMIEGSLPFKTRETGGVTRPWD